MTSNVVQLVARAVFFLAVISFISVSARSTHFTDSNQVSTDQENAINLDSSGLTPLQMEILAQRLSEYNNQIPQLPVGWDRLVRAPEMKRQSRFRQCYFNPVSCFRK